MDHFHQDTASLREEEKVKQGKDKQLVKSSPCVEQAVMSQRVNMMLNDDDTDANKNDGGDVKEEDEATLGGTAANNGTKRHEQSATTTVFKQRDEEDYQKLKKKFKTLRQEYIKVLESWEQTQKKVQQIAKERKFLRAKLESFMKQPIPTAQQTQQPINPPVVHQDQAQTIKPLQQQQQPSEKQYEKTQTLQGMHQQHNIMHQQNIQLAHSHQLHKESKRRKKDIIAATGQSGGHQLQPLQNQVQFTGQSFQGSVQQYTGAPTQTPTNSAPQQIRVNYPVQDQVKQQQQQQYYQREVQGQAEYNTNIQFRLPSHPSNTQYQTNQQPNNSNVMAQQVSQGLQFQNTLIQDSFSSQNFQNTRGGSIVNDTGFDSHDQRYSSNELFAVAPQIQQQQPKPTVSSQLSPRYYQLGDQQLKTTGGVSYHQGQPRNQQQQY